MIVRASPSPNVVLLSLMKCGQLDTHVGSPAPAVVTTTVPGSGGEK